VPSCGWGAQVGARLWLGRPRWGPGCGWGGPGGGPAVAGGLPATAGPPPEGCPGPGSRLKKAPLARVVHGLL